MVRKVPARVLLPIYWNPAAVVDRDADIARAINQVIDNFAGATFTLTTNTNLRISVKGSDGVTRSANLTLS